MKTPEVFEGDEQPIAWFRVTVGYMPPGKNQSGRSYRTSRVAWFFEHFGCLHRFLASSRRRAASALANA